MNLKSTFFPAIVVISIAILAVGCFAVTTAPLPPWALAFLQQNNLTAGTVRVYESFGRSNAAKPTPTYASNIGRMSERWRVPFPSDDFEAEYMIGSNTKLFVAVALYQLVEKGAIKSIDDDIADYLNESDFVSMGINNVTRYCPQVSPTSSRNSSSSSGGGCERISFADLLGMTSGIAIDPLGEFHLYLGNVASMLAGFILKPLMFKPGAAFFYANSGFSLATFLLEKISGLTFQQYLTANVLSKVRALSSSTRYDPYSGQLDASPRLVDESRVFLDAMNLSNILGRGTCRSELDMGSVNGAGGMTSTTADLAAWYQALFQFSANGSAMATPLLRAESLARIVAPRAPYKPGGPEAYYSQGVVTIWRALDRPLSSLKQQQQQQQQQQQLVAIWYQGATMCANTAIVYSIVRSLLVTVFSATQTYFVNASVFARWQQQTQGVLFSTLQSEAAQPYNALVLALLLLEKFASGK